MIEINASPGRILQIGYESEDNVTKIIFRYDLEWLSHGDGVFKVRVKRSCDTEAYNATEVIDDRENMTLTMTVTDIELSIKGHGEMQVVYIGADFVKKSPIYRYNVSRAIDSEVVNPPQGSIINELVQSVGDLTELTTTNKGNLVEAINEVNAKEGGGGGVSDVQVNGTSIVTDGVAEIPIGGAGVAGVYSIASNGRYGLMKNNEELRLYPAETGLIKSPFGFQASDSRPIVPKTQHMATFYGLAMAAGHAENTSTLPVGQYTEEAKTAIRTMLGLQDVYEDYSSALTALGVI